MWVYSLSCSPHHEPRIRLSYSWFVPSSIKHVDLIVCYEINRFTYRYVYIIFPAKYLNWQPAYQWNQFIHNTFILFVFKGYLLIVLILIDCRRLELGLDSQVMVIESKLEELPIAAHLKVDSVFRFITVYTN